MSSSDAHRVSPDSICQDGDFTNDSGTGGASICSNTKYPDDEKLVHRHTGPEILAQTQSSFDSLHGAVSKLSTLISQLAVSMGMQTTEELARNSAAVSAPMFSTAPSESSSTATAYVDPQIFGEMPQSYGFHNLKRQSIFLADGIERSYFTLPADYPLGQATPPMSPSVAEKVGVTAPPSVATHAAGLAPVLGSKAKSTACSESLLVPNLQLPINVQDASHVFKEMPVYDIYEEDNSCLNCMDEQLATPFHKASEYALREHLLTCFSKAPKTEEPSACLNIVTDVLDVTLELQQKDDEKTANCSVIMASDSVVTWSSQFGIEHSMRELRLLWDPGASAFLVVSPSNGGTNDTIDNEHVGQLVSITGDFSLHDKTDLWSQSEHQFIVLQGVFEEVMLDIPPAKPPDSKQLSAIQAIQGNCLILEAMPSLQRGAFSLGNFATSALWRPTTHAGDKISWGLNTAANSQNVLPCISVSDTKHICLFVKLSPWSILSAQHFIDSSMKKGSIFSAECTLPWNPWYAILLLHHCLWELPLSGTQRVQWDPGAKVSLYCWLDVLTAWSENDKPLCCTHSLAALQTQSVGNTASYVWNPGTMLLWYMSKGSLLFTEEKEMGGLIPKQWSLWFNTMHYCQIFQKYNALCCQQYSHQDIKLCGIPLWLINFRVP